MNRWERRLIREHLGMNRGRDRRLVYTSKSLESLQEWYDHGSHGLVSSVYDMAAQGDWIDPVEAQRRNRVALKTCVVTHGYYETKVRLTQAPASPARDNLLEMLKGLDLG